MPHPLYQPCLRAVNRPVTVHLRSGENYHGILQRVSPSGLYLRPNGSTASANAERADVSTADNRDREAVDAENVFFPFFFPFAALAGFTLGFAAGAIATRPYYGGYGRGFYW